MQNIEINIEDALQKTKEVAKSKNEGEDKFSKYAPIYMGPTGNVYDLIKLYQENNIKKALVVGSQGSFAYELALKTNVEEIDCFDRNILQYLFFELYDTAIKTYSFKNFQTNFTSKKYGRMQEFSSMLSDDMFFDLLEVMNEEEKAYAKEYWKQLFMSTNDFGYFLQSNLFRTYYPLDLEYLKKYSSVYNSEDFNKLQKILNNKQVQINYYICDIDEIHKLFANKKYDLIIFGNILQYYQSIPALNNIAAINRYVKEKWDSLLNENGQIQLGYGFETSTFAVNQVLGRKNKTNFNVPDSLISMANKNAIKKEFISNMLKKYQDCYSVDFIPGVEQANGYPNAENAILTYKKK